MNKSISLEVPDSISDLVKIQEEEIRVNFEVVEFLEGNKRLKIKKLNFPNSVTLEDEDETIMISYLVDERRSPELKEQEFEAVLDYYKRNKEDSTLEVQVKPMPEYLEQVVAVPAILKLKYE